MKRIYFLTEKRYTCPDTGKTLTRPAGYPSDGSSGGLDINSGYWKFHDVACDKAVWDDGTPMTPKDCSSIAKHCLLHEGRPVRAIYIYWVTLVWTSITGIGHHPNRQTCKILAGETRRVTKKVFEYYMRDA